jgi:hypothetical protein
MSTAMFYLVQTEISMTWIGGPLKPADNGHVWLTSPDGEPVLKVPSSAVTATTKEEIARRIVADRQAATKYN